MSSPRTWRARLTGEPVERWLHDGDTLRLCIDNGFESCATPWLRLQDVHAPELDEPGGLDTRAYLADLLLWARPDEGRWPFTVTTWLTAGDNDVRTLARYVARVTITAAGRDVNQAVQDHVTRRGYGPGVGG